MKSQLDLARAIGAEFVGRKLRPLVIAFFVAALLAVALAVWLTTINGLWWLLAVPVITAAIVGGVACLAARSILKMLRPPLSSGQKIATVNFVDKLERVAETVQTPMFVIVFRIIHDMYRPSSRSFIAEVSADSTTLRADFLALARKF